MSPSRLLHKLAAFAILTGSATLLVQPVQANISGITSDPAVASGKTFDYIIIGVGTAGTTVAARLAEDPTLTILMIEVGGDHRTNPDVFNLSSQFNLMGGPLDWAWPAEQGKVIHG